MESDIKPRIKRFVVSCFFKLTFVKKIKEKWTFHGVLIPIQWLTCGCVNSSNIEKKTCVGKHRGYIILLFKIVFICLLGHSICES